MDYSGLSQGGVFTCSQCVTLHVPENLKPVLNPKKYAHHNMEEPPVGEIRPSYHRNVVQSAG